MNDHQAIVCATDPQLTVYIDRERATAQVFYRYGWSDGSDSDPEIQSAPYQTADMPMDDQRAASMIKNWLE